MEYETEFEKLNEAKGEGYFKPTVGVHILKIVEEPVKCQFLGKEGAVDQIKILVNIDGKEGFWFVTKGVTTRSLYGQLICLGKFKGRLAGETITLSVTNERGKDGQTRNSYQILEAVKILPLLQKIEEERVM
jgi:hypothetical protein